MAHLGGIPNELRLAHRFFELMTCRKQVVDELPFFSHARQNNLKLCQLVRFGEEVGRTMTEGGYGVLNRRFSRENHRLTVGGNLLEPRNDFDATQPWHIEIDYHAIKRGSLNVRQSAGSIIAYRDIMSQATELDIQDFTQGLFVIGKEYFQPFKRLGSDGTPPLIDSVQQVEM